MTKQISAAEQQQKEEQRRRELRCYNCKELGHKKADCNKDLAKELAAMGFFFDPERAKTMCLSSEEANKSGSGWLVLPSCVKGSRIFLEALVVCPDGVSRKMDILLDTGSQVSVLRSSFCSFSGSSNSTSIIGASGHVIGTASKILKPVHVLFSGGFQKDIGVLAMDYLCADMILGIHDIKKLGMVIVARLHKVLVPIGSSATCSSVNSKQYVTKKTLLNKLHFVKAVLNSQRGIAVVETIDTKQAVQSTQLPEELSDMAKFFESNSELPPLRGFLDCSLKLKPGCEPPLRRVLPLTGENMVLLKDYLDTMLKKGFIQPSKAPWGRE